LPRTERLRQTAAAATCPPLVAYHAAVAPDGEIVLAGQFHGVMDFGAGPIESHSGGGAFLARFDPLGLPCWSRVIGTGGVRAIHAVTFDRSDVLVLGECRGVLDLDGAVHRSVGQQAAFVAKFDASGKHLWSTCLPASVTCRSIATNSAGHVLLAGHFGGAADFGRKVLTCASSEDVFVLQLDPAGSVVDVAQFSGSRAQRACRVTVTAQDHVIVTGYFEGAIDLGSEPLESSTGWELFIGRYDAEGRHLWSRRFEVASMMRGHAAAVDRLGNLFLAGNLKRCPELGVDEPATSSAAFLAKLDATGKAVYAKGLPASAMEYRQGLAVDALGHAAVTGHVREHVGDDWTMFVTKFDSSGRAAWSRRFGGTNGHFLQKVRMDATGGVVLTGAFHGAIDFGGGLLASGTNEAIFLVKLAP